MPTPLDKLQKISKKMERLIEDHNGEISTRLLEDPNGEISTLLLEYSKAVKLLTAPEPTAPFCAFTMPVNVTDELCAFLGIPRGTMIARNDVTKRIMAYVREPSP